MLNKLIALACSTAFVCGCSSTGPGHVTKSWTENLRELGVYPIYPPREDVSVGDVFINSASDESPDGFRPLGVLLMSIDTNESTEKRYALRYRHSPSNGESITTKAKEYEIVPANKNGKTTPLRQVALPYFLTAKVTGADVEAFIPVDALQRGFKVGTEAITGASVSVTAAESYSLPMTDLLPAFIKSINCYSNNETPSAQAKDFFLTLPLATPSIPNDKGERHVEITIINEVFYARTFDITLHVSRSASAKVNAQLPNTTKEDVVKKNLLDDGGVGSGSSDENLAALDDNQNAKNNVKPKLPDGNAVASALSTKSKQTIQNINIPSTPGVTASAIRAESGDIGLRSTYDYPIAFGYRGTRLRANIILTESNTNPDSSSKDNKEHSAKCKLLGLAPTYITTYESFSAGIERK